MNYKHGLANNHPLYKCWKQMHQRCYNPSADQYKFYGRRGIKVDVRWHDFENFIADVGKRPEGMTLDRIDNNKNYSKDNFKWSTQREQCNNRKNTKFIEFNGVTKSTYNWGRSLGITSKKGLREFSRKLHNNWSFLGTIKWFNKTFPNESIDLSKLETI